MTRFFHYSNFGAHLGELELYEVAHSCEINAVNELSFVSDEVLAERDRILWSDGTLWHEHVFQQSEQSHGETTSISYVFRASYQADLRLFSIAALKVEGPLVDVVSLLLEGTNWDVGTIADRDCSFEFQGVTIYQALTEICNSLELEIEPVIEVDSLGVFSRKINIIEAIGTDRAVRFDYSYNLEGVTKTVLDEDVYTAAYGFGADSGKEIDGMKLKVTVYLENPLALERWGIPDGKGGLLHSVGKYENSDCLSSSQLQAETAAFLDAHSTPQISYEIAIVGEEMSQVELGDLVHVVDRDFVPELRLAARVVSLKKDLTLGLVTEVTLGTSLSILPDTLVRTWQMAQTALQTPGSGSQVTSQLTALSSALTDMEARIKALEEQR